MTYTTAHIVQKRYFTYSIYVELYTALVLNYILLVNKGENMTRHGISYYRIKILIPKFISFLFGSPPLLILHHKKPAAPENPINLSPITPSKSLLPH